VHCSSDASSSGPEMTEDECLRILDEARQIGVNEVTFSGGEPLIWPALYKAVEFTSRHGLRSIIYTSGNGPDVSCKIQQLKQLGADCCIFSLFGYTDLTHDRITRKRGSFKATLDAIECAHTNKIRSEIHFVPFAENFREIEGIAELAGERGVQQISVLRFVPQGRGYLYRTHRLSKLQNLELKRLILELRKAGCNVRTGSPYNFLLLNKDAQCLSGINRIIVGPDLRIYPCDAFKQIKAEELIGSLAYSCLDNYSLLNCWDSSPFLLAVREYLTTPFVEPCASCSVLEQCLSGCLAQKVIANGSLEKCSDPDCIRYLQ